MAGAALGFALCVHSEEKHAELGRIPWLRDAGAAFRQAKASGKPVLLLFDEVPG